MRCGTLGCSVPFLAAAETPSRALAHFAYLGRGCAPSSSSRVDGGLSSFIPHAHGTHSDLFPLHWSDNTTLAGFAAFPGIGRCGTLPFSTLLGNG